MFKDRLDAGQQLAQRLKQEQLDDPIVLALPRGGVPIGYEIAKQLNISLDVLVVRKLGASWNPEAAIGAIAPGVQVLSEYVIQMLEISSQILNSIIYREQQELQRRIHLYRGEAKFPNINNKTVILVDDGLATGFTMQAAIQATKQLKANKIIVAVPVGAEDTIKMLTPMVDKIICLEIPKHFLSVGLHYQDFSQVSDAEVTSILQQTPSQLVS